MDGAFREKGRKGEAYSGDTAIVGWNCMTDRIAGAGFIPAGAKGAGFAKPTGNVLLLEVGPGAGRNTCTY